MSLRHCAPSSLNAPRTRVLAWLAPLVALLLPGLCLAQVSEGNSEVTSDGFEAPAKVDPPENDDATEASIQGGGLLAGGNARSFALTSSGRLLLRRSEHQFTSNAAMNYAAAADPEVDDSGLQTTVENYQGKLRYDYFITNRLSAFLAVQGRHDSFQNLNLRLSVDPGLAYYFVKTSDINLWGEAGYDFQFDILTDEALEEGEATGDPRDRTETDHNARLFAGYSHTLEERLSLNTGLEFLKSFVIAESWRLNWNAELQTKIIDDLSFAVGSSVMFNNTPLPGVEELDVVTSLSFVYTLL